MQQATVTDNNYKTGQLRRWQQMRETSYPDDACPDTIVVAERYKLNYHRARILHALSYGMSVPVLDMCALTKLPPEVICHEVHRMAEFLGISVKVGKVWGNIPKFFFLENEAFCQEVRDHIHMSWRKG